MKTIAIITTLFAAVMMVGCASQSELDEVRQTAENAQRTADNAAECCATNSQKVNRMYQKLMAK